MKRDGFDWRRFESPQKVELGKIFDDEEVMSEHGKEQKTDEGHDHGESAEGKELASGTDVLAVRTESVKRVIHPWLHVHRDLAADDDSFSTDESRHQSDDISCDGSVHIDERNVDDGDELREENDVDEIRAKIKETVD